MGNERLQLERRGARSAVTSLWSWLDRLKASGLAHIKAFASSQHRENCGSGATGVANSLHRILEVVPVVAVVLDDAGGITGANGRATRFFGYAPNELTGMPIDSLLVPSRGDEGLAMFGAANIVDGAPHSVTRVATVRAKNGTDIKVHLSLSAPLAFGPSAAVVVVIEPDTGETTTVSSGDEPRHLQRKGASEIGDMAAALAHEVDQPLTAILSNAQAAQRFLAQTPPAMSDLRELLGEIAADSARAHAIIRKMRQSARCEAAETNVVDVGSLVRDVIRRLRRETQACRAAVGARIEDGLPQLRGDWVQLQQVLVNLLRNALDAVDECRVEDRRISIVVTATEDRGKVCIVLRDRGPGVEADQFATLFKPFVTSKPQGLGLGLSISRTIVMAHGGQLWAERNTDRGMTFHVELPAESAAAKTATR